MKPLTIQHTKLISRLTFTTLLCGSLIAQSASAARTPRRTSTATSAQQQQLTVHRRPATTGQAQSSAPRRPRPQTGASSVVIPTRPQVDPTPTRDPRPHVDPVPTFPGRPTRPPRPTVPVNPTVPTVPSNPTFPPSRPLPPSNPVPSANPLPSGPANSTPAPRNPLPTPEQGAPENAAPSDRIVPADEKLAREVASDVQQLLDDGLKGLNDSFQSFGDDELVAESGLGDQLLSFQQSIRDGASLEQIAEQGRAAYDTLASLHSNEDGPEGLGEWAEGLAQDVSKMALMAAIDKSIADALANGLGPANGPLGPMDLAHGVGGGGGVGPWGPGDLAPGVGGGGGGGGGGGLGPMGPGGLALPMGGGGGGFGFGFGWFGGFHIHLHVNFWFGHGWCPMICCPGLPWGHCCWIGPHVLCCGVGHFGHPCVCYGPPAYCGLPYCLVAPLPNALPHVNYLGRILLLNPAENVGEIHYLLSGDPHLMEAGMMQEMRRDVTVIRFDRGPGFGEARYTLRPGTYRFVVTEDGWDLVKVTFQATLDNTANASDFNLLLDGEPVTVPARSEQVVTSPYPLLVEFSNGSEVVGKQLADEKVYTIGINDSGKWDLFPGNAIASGAGEAGQIQVLAAAEGVEPPHAIDLPTE